jgi:hypothetical protein
MTDYSKAAVEHALTVLSVETEQEVEMALQDGYAAFYQLNHALYKKAIGLRYKPIYQGTREDLAAVVLYAAAMLYEWDKSRPTSDPVIH